MTNQSGFTLSTTNRFAGDNSVVSSRPIYSPSGFQGPIRASDIGAGVIKNDTIGKAASAIVLDSPARGWYSATNGWENPTNGIKNGGFRIVNSNGMALVSLWNSNGVLVVKQISP